MNSVFATSDNIWTIFVQYHSLNDHFWSIFVTFCLFNTIFNPIWTHSCHFWSPFKTIFHLISDHSCYLLNHIFWQFSSFSDTTLEKSSSVLMSPESLSPTRSYVGSKDYSLSEIHTHLVRSPPPVSWPMSPRSNGTFSPDSSDMDVDNPPLQPIANPPTRGYSPYNRSQSEEHILSPCRELLKSAEFSPVSHFYFSFVLDKNCESFSIHIGEIQTRA